jgi:hypothetical protein
MGVRRDPLETPAIPDGAAAVSAAETPYAEPQRRSGHLQLRPARCTDLVAWAVEVRATPLAHSQLSWGPSFYRLLSGPTAETRHALQGASLCSYLLTSQAAAWPDDPPPPLAFDSHAASHCYAHCLAVLEGEAAALEGEAAALEGEAAALEGKAAVLEGEAAHVEGGEEAAEGIGAHGGEAQEGEGRGAARGGAARRPHAARKRGNGGPGVRLSARRWRALAAAAERGGGARVIAERARAAAEGGALDAPGVRRARRLQQVGVRLLP